MSRRSRSSRTTSVFPQCILTGVLAYFCGYLLTYVLIVGQVTEQLSQLVPPWKAVGWYFYNAHFVELTHSMSAGGFGRTRTNNLITATTSANADLLYLVPPVVLIVGGFSLNRWLGGIDEPLVAAKTGAFVSVGYIGCVLLGVILTAHTASANLFVFEVSKTIQPLPSQAVILAGIIYPVLFGGIGSFLARRETTMLGQPRE